MSWCGKLWHLIGNVDCINLFADRKTLLMDLYAFVSLCIWVCARNATVICCCQRWRTTLTLHQLHFADANRHQKMTTRTYTYFLRQSKGCMFSYASLLFSPSCSCALFPLLSLSLSLVSSLKCWQSMKQNANSFSSRSLQCIRIFIQSFVLFLEYRQTYI